MSEVTGRVRTYRFGCNLGSLDRLNRVLYFFEKQLDFNIIMSTLQQQRSCMMLKSEKREIGEKKRARGSQGRDTHLRILRHPSSWHRQACRSMLAYCP